MRKRPLRVRVAQRVRSLPLRIMAPVVLTLVVALVVAAALLAGTAPKEIVAGPVRPTIGLALPTTAPIPTLVDVPVSDTSPTLPPASTAAPGAPPAAPGPTVVPTSPNRPVAEVDEAENGPGGGRVLPAPRRPPPNNTATPYGTAPFRGTTPLPDGVVSILLVGSDARPGENPTIGTRGDSLHVVLLNPRTGVGAIIGIPRDSWVEIPGRGPAKINAALAWQGPQGQAEAVQRLTGLPLNYYVVTGFAGFEALIRDNGGSIVVNVDRPINDPWAGLNIGSGWQSLNPQQALGFARARKTLPRGDFDRSRHQGDLILASVRKLRAETNDVAGLQAVIDRSLRHVSWQGRPDEALPLLGAARTANPDNISNVVIPGRGATISGQSVVVIDTAAMGRIVDDARRRVNA